MGVAEHRHAQADRGRHVPAVARADHPFGMAGQRQTLFDRAPEGAHAEHLQRHPQLQRAERTGRLDTQIAVVGQPVRIGVVVLHVGGHGAEGLREPVAVPHQQGRTLDRLEQPFVAVDHHRIGPLDAGQLTPPLLAQQGSTTVGRVHMQPQAMAVGQIGQLGQRIDGAGVGRAGADGQAEGLQPRRQIGLDQLRQGRRVHAKGGIVGHQTQAVPRQAQHLQGRADAGVRLLARVDDRPAPHAAQPDAARHAQAGQIGARPTGLEQTAGPIRQAGQVA